MKGEILITLNKFRFTMYDTIDYYTAVIHRFIDLFIGVILNEHLMFASVLQVY